MNVAVPVKKPNREARRGRAGSCRHAPDTDQQGRHQGHLSSGQGEGSGARRAAHGREFQHVREPAAQLQGHAHVALRRDPASARARNLGRFVRQDAGGDDRASGCERRPHRNDVSLLRHEEGAGHRRREPDELPGDHFRRAPRRQDRRLAQGRGPDHQPVPLLEEDLGLRRAQSALAHHPDGEARRAHVARGADRHRRERKPHARCMES